tara:strand:+ start:167 stop:733 length:567 start_codon:yes stop_codon:yes gene_type:complete
MKNIHFILIATAGIATALTGCKGTQGITPAQNGEVAIIEYCTGSEYTSNSEYFRGSSSATSPKREIAKKQAKLNARADLAKMVNITVAAVAEDHVNSTDYNDKATTTGIFNEITRSTTEEALRGSIPICEKLTQRPDGQFVFYTAYELSGEQLSQAYSESLSKDERIMAEFNYENFKETFNAEMAKRQ